MRCAQNCRLFQFEMKEQSVILWKLLKNSKIQVSCGNRLLSSVPSNFQTFDLRRKMQNCLVKIEEFGNLKNVSCRHGNVIFVVDLKFAFSSKFHKPALSTLIFLWLSSMQLFTSYRTGKSTIWCITKNFDFYNTFWYSNMSNFAVNCEHF